MKKFWCIGILCLGVLSLIMSLSYVWIITTPYFGLKKVVIKGNKMVLKEWVLKKSGILRGENIFSMNLNRMSERIKNSSPWIDKVVISRNIPDEIVIEIKEKIPFYWMVKNEKLFYADESGNIIAPVKERKFVVLPVLRLVDDVNADEIQTLTETFLEFQYPFLFSDIGYIKVEFDIVEVFIPKFSAVIEFDRRDLKFSFYLLKRVWDDLKKRDEVGSIKRILVYNNCVWVKMERIQ